MTFSQMRVCMLIPSFYPRVAGAERQAMMLSRALRGMGHDAWVLTRRMPGTSAYEEIDGVPVHRVFARKPSTWTFMPAALLYLLRKQHTFDVLHVHTVRSPALTGALVHRLTGKPVIAKIPRKEQFEYVRQSWPRLWWMRRHIARFVAVNAVSHHALLAAGIESSRNALIPNGVDTSLFKPPTSEEKLALRARLGLGEEPVATFVGRLIPRKQVHVLLRAWPFVLDVRPEAHLLIVGDGPQRSDLECLARDLDVAQQVTFVGECSQQAVEAYLGASDVFVLPSLSEGISNALLEAMAVGLVPVVSRVDGNTDVVVHEVSGLMVESGDADDLGRQMRRLLVDEDLRQRLQRGALRTIEERFALSRVATAYANMYDELLRAASCTG